ncbi:MAG: hypothetical protein WCS03_08350 [Bacteroidota bacterium]
MKKFMITSILLTLFATGTNLMAQDQQEESLGLPGDNLNLYAVMKVFRESETLEGFEKSLNDENSKINNLDLNGDNLVDYIRVIDNIDGDVHNIVLQVALDQRENQDVAVFTVQRDEYGKVQIQLTGDEALYGKDYIIEPVFDDVDAGQTPNPGYTGDTRTIDGRNVTVHRTTTVEIAAWPLIRFIYFSNYKPWRSSWNYGYYPSYWHPWQPFYWDYYYGYHYNLYNDYYSHYRHSGYHRYTRWNDYYWYGKRSHSNNLSVRIQSGNYKNTYSHPDQTTRRSTTTVTNKSVSNPTSKHNAVTNRSSRQSTSTGVKSSSRRSSESGKSKVTPKKTEKTKDSETTKSTHRR